jgi:membrane-associated phospholipid phosphatase
MRKNTPNLNKLAKVISTIGNPMVIALFFGLYIQYISKNDTNYKNLPIIFTLIIVLPIAFYIYKKVKSNAYVDYDVSDRVKRNSLYKFIIPLFLLLTLVTIIFKFPLKVILVAGVFLVQISISALLNKSFKVSMHTSLCYLFAYLFYPLNPAIAYFLFGFGFLILWSRVQLNRHSPKEVIAGFLLGNIVGGLYLWLVYMYVIPQ